MGLGAESAGQRSCDRMAPGSSGVSCVHCKAAKVWVVSFREAHLMTDSHDPSIPPSAAGPVAAGPVAASTSAGPLAMDPVAVMRSRPYLSALLLAAILGIPISAIAYGFLALTNKMQEL